jgi:DNA-binding NarL/FixJ family response regulator
MYKPTTILVADDHPVFRKGLIDIISEEESLQIIADAADGKSAFKIISEKLPDIAILDINMPELTGFDVAKAMIKQKSKTKIIFLTMHKEKEILNKAFDFSAAGYILKECAVDEIIDCINFVKEGKTYISPQISNILLERSHLHNEYKDKIEKLSLTEKKILSLIAEEKTSREIADELFISIRTVENHRLNICHKLQLSGVNSLLKFALDNKHLF